MLQNLKDIVTTASGTYYVSTSDTYDMGLETMIFKCKVPIPKEFDDIEWSGVYIEHHRTIKHAIERHNEIKNNIEKYINER